MAAKQRPSKRGRTKAREKTVISGLQPKSRPVRKTVYLSTDHAYKLQVLSAMSSFNGSKLEQSAVVEEALEMWFAANDLPTEFEVKMSSTA